MQPAGAPGRASPTARRARAVNVCATFLVIYAVDRWGRRKVLIGGAVHMLITQVVIAGLLGRFYSAHMPVDVSIVVVVFVCLFVSGHAWSWGARGARGRHPSAMRAAELPRVACVKSRGSCLVHVGCMPCVCGCQGEMVRIARRARATKACSVLSGSCLGGCDAV
jgi:hypothetical protein